jgi:hypothetical protein
MMVQPPGGFQGNLHPRAPKGSPGGGQFAPGGGGAAASSSSARTAPARKGSTAARPAARPNGLGYSNAQWSHLQALEAKAKAGGKLDAHELHQLHVAHQKRAAAMAKPKATPKPKAAKKAAKPKATPKLKAAKPRTASARKPAAPATRRVTVQQVTALRAAGYR